MHMKNEIFCPYMEQIKNVISYQTHCSRHFYLHDHKHLVFPFLFDHRKNGKKNEWMRFPSPFLWISCIHHLRFHFFLLLQKSTVAPPGYCPTVGWRAAAPPCTPSSPSGVKRAWRLRDPLIGPSVRPTEDGATHCQDVTVRKNKCQ